MATATKFSRGAATPNSWANAGSALADDGLYASAAPGKNATVSGDWDFAAFTDAEIPVGATIDSALIEAQWKVSTTASVATLGLHGLIGGVADGAETVVTTEPTVDTIAQKAIVVTESDVKTAGQVVARVRATRGSTNTAFTATLDYVKLVVTYTAAVPKVFGQVPATAGASATVAGRRTLRSTISASAAATATVSAARKLRAQVTATAGATAVVAGGVSAKVTATVTAVAGSTVIVTGSRIVRSTVSAAAGATSNVTGRLIRRASATATAGATAAAAGLRTLRASADLTGTALASAGGGIVGQAPTYPNLAKYPRQRTASQGFACGRGSSFINQEP